MKFKLFVSDGSITHQMSKVPLSKLVKFIEDKSYDISCKHHENLVMLSGSKQESFFFIVEDKEYTKQDILEMCREMESIYIFLPAEKAKGYTYTLGMTNDGKEAIVNEETDELFSIVNLDNKYKMPGLKPIRTSLTFDQAYEYNKKILYEQILMGETKLVEM